MKLIYRGNIYEYDRDQANPGNAGRPVRPAHASQAPYTLVYRGLTLQVDPQAMPQESARPMTYDLLYRGTAYHVSRDGSSVNMTTQPAATMRSRRASSPQALDKIHQANLLNNLQRRLQAAQERGDQTLIELLEAERRQIGI